jgi:thiopeptide-type bacteriocin biosynthesis protein
MTYALDGFVLRTPLLPAAQFIDLAAESPPDAGGSAEGFAGATETIRARLRTLVALPEVAEALFIASPALADSVPAWLVDPLSQRGQKVERSLVKYLARMSTRATPFGLFSGCSTGRMADRTRLRLAPRSQVARHSRLDMDYLFALTETLNRGPGVRARLRFRPNDTLVVLGGRYRYVEPRVGGSNTRRYHLVAVERTPYLALVLEASATGAMVRDLVNRLLEYDGELSADEARGYVDELIDSHVLVSTLQPPVTGPEPAGEIAVHLRALGAEQLAARLEAAVAQLHRLDAGGIGQPVAEYHAILETLKPLPAPVEVSRLVQVDMRKPGELTLGPMVRAEIERCAEAVATFGVVHDRLGAFRIAFEKRYGMATMPLLQVLDEESGIGLGDVSPADESPLIAGFPISGRSDAGDATWRPRHAWLLDRLQSAWSKGATEITVSDEELARAFASPSPVPPTPAVSVGFTLAASSPEALDRGDFSLELRGILGPSGARILGRFCHVDPDISAIVGEHLREEEAQETDAVFAEVVHLPQGRLGNVILRPLLRSYELTYLGRSGAPEEQQIPLSDLRVTVRNGRTILWSARLGRRVVPRLTNAHNFLQPGGLVPYKFLALLQTEGVRSGFGWDWGPLANAAYLPRVRWGRCVLSRASWRATADELRPLAKAEGATRFTTVRDWARQLRMPRLVELVDGDNELLVDFDNPLSVEAFIDLVEDRPLVRLSEMYPGPSDLCVSSDEGAFTHEIYVPVVRRPEPAVADSRSSAMLERSWQTPSGRRSISPGSEWLFVKVYTGAAEADRVLTEAVAPLVADAYSCGLIDRWFFMRFADPDYHLRLRFRGDARALHGDLLVRLSMALDPALTAGAVSRVQLDTYQPEVERYGGDGGLDLSEQVFQADSDAVLALLGELDGDSGADARWQLALRGLEEMVEDFGFEGAEKREIIARRRRDYGIEFNVDNSPLRHALGDRFRHYRRVLEELSKRDRDATSELAPGFAIWRRRSATLRPIADALRAVEHEGRLDVPVATLVDSYLHMFVNRLARAHARTHELVMFDFLDRQLESLEARGRRRANPKPKKADRAAAV